jgi:hypothetical protein
VIKAIRHRLRVWKAERRERKKDNERSSQWPRVRDAFKKNRPCAACGGIERLQVHHKKPFHLARMLELEPKNLIVLCMGPPECHLRIGHGDDFEAYNPHVEIDSILCYTHPSDRATVETKARLSRRY